MTEQPNLNDLWALVQEQQREIKDLRNAVGARVIGVFDEEADEGEGAATSISQKRLSRSTLFKLAAVGVAGAAGLDLADPKVAAACYGLVQATAFEAHGNFTDACNPGSGYTGFSTLTTCKTGGDLSGDTVGLYGWSFVAPYDVFNGPKPDRPTSGQYGVYGTNSDPTVYGEGVHGKALASGTGVAGESSAGKGLWGTSSSGDGVHGDSLTGVGVYGASNNYAGVVGSSGSAGSFAIIGGNTNNGWGVIGKSYNGNGGVLGSGVGVEGNSGSGIGVHGTSDSGYGVQGVSVSSSGVSGLSHATDSAAVYGVNDTGADGSTGVLGTSLNNDTTLGSGTGVQGYSGSGVAIRGNSEGGTGVVAASSTYLGLLAFSGNPVGASAYSYNTANGWGLIGRCYSDDQVTLGSGIGVEGDSGSGIGVKGSSDSGKGISGVSSSGDGVHGDSGKGVGIYGSSKQYIGVLGSSASSGSFAVYGGNTGNGWGVIGRSYSGNAGVLGSGVGVEGDSGSGTGVKGASRSGAGIVGSSQQGRGGTFAGPAAAVNLAPSAAKSHPKSGQAGDLFLDSASPRRLWLCTVGRNTAATWRRVKLV